jgi:hypothetical protein
MLILFISLIFITALTEAKDYKTSYLIPEIVDNPSIKVVVDENTTPFYDVTTQDINFLVNTKIINNILTVNLWIKNITNKDYLVNPKSFYVTDVNKMLISQLNAEETINYLYGFNIAYDYTPLPYQQERTNYRIISTYGGYNVYSSPDVYASITNAFMKSYNKAQLKAVKETKEDRAKALQELRLILLKEEEIPPNTIKYSQIFYKYDSMVFPILLYFREKDTVLQLKFYQAPTMGIFSRTNFTKYKDSKQSNMLDIIANSLQILNRFNLVTITGKQNTVYSRFVQTNYDDEENVKKLSDITDILFIPEINLKEQRKLTLTIYNLKTGKIIYNNEIITDKIVANPSAEGQYEIVINAYSDIYNDLLKTIINNSAKF